MPKQRQAAADDAGTGPLWFTPPGGEQNRRPVLTRDRVVAEALAIISADGAAALSMRALATRLGVVPAALYRHVGSKEQLYDLILDGVLAEVDCQADPALPWAGQVTALASRLRAVLEDHPGIAALLKTRDPVSPASLALAEAFLAPLQAAGLPGRQAALAFRLIYDYTLGFALSDRTSPGEQRVQDSATRAELHAFLRSLPASRFPALAALGAYAWADDRDQRFTASLDALVAGLRATLRPALVATSGPRISAASELGEGLPRLGLPGPAPHSQGTQDKGTEEHGNADEQHVQQAVDDDAHEAEHDRHDHQEKEEGKHLMLRSVVLVSGGPVAVRRRRLPDRPGRSV
jgi:AcrR family transcriptional regulator